MFATFGAEIIGHLCSESRKLNGRAWPHAWLPQKWPPSDPPLKRASVARLTIGPKGLGTPLSNYPVIHGDPYQIHNILRLTTANLLWHWGKAELHSPSKQVSELLPTNLYPTSQVKVTRFPCWNWLPFLSPWGRTPGFAQSSKNNHNGADQNGSKFKISSLFRKAVKWT